MADLFIEPDVVHRLHIPDADVRFAHRIDCGRPADELLRELIDTIPWRAETITLWGRQIMQPRLLAWCGDPEARYTYSGVTHDPLPWSPLLTSLREHVTRVTGATFNSVLCNQYRDHRDSMGFHSDDEPELGSEPVIASLSFGATRTFVLRHRHRKDLRAIKLELPSASLLLMQGATQSNWKHAVPKQAHPCGPRVNLTFRTIHPREMTTKRWMTHL